MAKKEEANQKIFDYATLKKIFPFVRPYLSHFYVVIFLTLLLGVVAPVRPYLIKYAVDDCIAAYDMAGLNSILIWLLVFVVLQGLLEFVHTYYSAWLGQHIVRDVRLRVFDHILGLRLSFYDKTPVGRLVTRNISDVQTLSDIFTQGLANIIGDLLQIAFIFAAMLYLDWQLTLVSLLVLPFLILSTYIFKEKVKMAFNLTRTAVSNLNSFVQEHLTGMAIVQIFNSQEREYEKFKEINREHRRAQIKTVLYYSLYFPIAEIVTAVGTGLVVWYGAKSVLLYDLELGTLIAFILFLGMFFRPIRMLADRFNTLQMGIVGADRITQLLAETQNIQDEGHLAPTHLEGHIAFENVWFAYQDQHYVLQDISFEILPAQKIAFVGATGAGKSSIINLINRFYEIQKGQILIDHQPLNTYKLATLRRNIGVVLQDVFLFSGSILENITLGDPSISIEQVRQVATFIGAIEFIEKLPGGFEYQVKERGASLSVGQRQLISFVRAMVYNPQVIILDEATSSVDSETEALIQNAIEKMMQGRTAIIIAHRLATIQKADTIIVLDKGRIVEQGNHEALLRQNGYYKQLYEMQFLQALQS
jgi:ATP-binding cassette, subfamily B, multidrug efflux pump